MIWYKLVGSASVLLGLAVQYREIIELFGTLKIMFHKKTENTENLQQSASVKGNVGSTTVYNIANSNVSVEALKELTKDEEIKKVEEIEHGGINHRAIIEIKEAKTNYKKAKELLEKVYSHLDKSEPLSVIGDMSLRLCRSLEMDKYIEWLEKEIYGYGQSTNKKPLESRERDESKYPKYRSINAELQINFTGKEIEDMQKFDLPLFISQPLVTIENWVKSAGDSERIALKMPPISLMVDKLKVSPDDEVPYIIQVSLLRELLNGFRLELSKFLTEAKEEIDKRLS